MNRADRRAAARMKRHGFDAGRREQSLPALPLTFGLPQDVSVGLQLAPHVVFDVIRRGAGTEEDWHTLTCSINVGAVLSRSEPDEVQAVMCAGLDAVRSFYRRAKPIDRWVMTGDEMTAIRDAVVLADRLMSNVSRLVLAKAYQTVLDETKYLEDAQK